MTEAIPMTARPPAPLPDDIAGYLLKELPAILGAEDMFGLERLVEFAFHTGYAQGHLRGYQTGERDQERRTALAAREAKSADRFPQAAAS